MEKSAEFQYMVSVIKRKLILRLPGGEEIPYDDRFGILTDILKNDGDYKIFT